MKRKSIELIIKKLIKEQITISTMESCTSGLIASKITDTEGASSIFPGGYVTYCNEAKVAAGVDADILRKYGVYSRECAEAMAKTVQDNMSTDIAIGVTGTTGNVDLNNTDSVQGKMFFCILIKRSAHTFEYTIDVGDMKRADIKEAYVEKVFSELSMFI